MEEQNPFHGIKTCDNYARLGRLTGFILVLQVAVSAAVWFFAARAGADLSQFEVMIPVLFVTAYVSWTVLGGLGVSWRGALSDWSRNFAGDVKIALKYFAGYGLVLAGLFLILCAVYWFSGEVAEKVMRPLSDRNLREDSQLQVVAAFSRLRFLLVLFSACVAAPLVEEVFFRRIVFAAIRLKQGFWVSAFWSGLLFAVFHGAAIHVILPIGMYFCWVYERERRLPVNIMLHSLVNLSMITLKVLI